MGRFRRRVKRGAAVTCVMREITCLVNIEASKPGNYEPENEDGGGETNAHTHTQRCNYDNKDIETDFPLSQMQQIIQS